MDESWTILNLLKWATDYLAKHAIENSKLESEILLSETLGVRRLDLYLNFDKPLAKEELGRFKNALLSRLKFIPYQYIFQRAYFRDLILYVDENVLIPRPETELLVDLAAEQIEKQRCGNRHLTIVDIGSGSGCIAIALAMKYPQLPVIALEKSSAAYQIATRNAERYLTENLTLLNLDIANFDFNIILTDLVVVSNPPYIPTEELRSLQPEVRQEPTLALDGGADGLDCYRITLGKLAAFSRNITFCFEIGYNQRPLLEALCQLYKVNDCSFRRDYEDIDRFVLGTMNKGAL